MVLDAMGIVKREEEGTLENCENVQWLESREEYVIIDISKFYEDIDSEDWKDYECGCPQNNKNFEEICEKNNLDKDKYIIEIQ